MYELWFIKPKFEKHVSLLCLQRNQSGELLDSPGGAGPASARSRRRDAAVAYSMIIMLIRDPALRCAASSSS